MNANFAIPDDFRASIFPEWVHIVTANAVIRSQYVERVLNGMCLFLRTEGLQFSVEDFMSGDSARTRHTLGEINKQLRRTDLFEPSFSDRLQRFTRRRNRIVHGLFADSFKSSDDISIDSQKAQEYGKECEWVAEEAVQLVEVGFGIGRVLGNILLASNPDHRELADLLRDLDEFYEEGLASIASKFRLYLASKNANVGGA